MLIQLFETSPLSFVKVQGDTSGKQFYRILKDNSKIMIKVNDFADQFDEVFDTNNTGLSQSDYFLHIFDVLAATTLSNSVPKILEHSKNLFVMESVGPHRLKDYITNSPEHTLTAMKKAIDLLIKYQSTDITPLIESRKYDTQTIKKEIQLYNPFTDIELGKQAF